MAARRGRTTYYRDESERRRFVADVFDRTASHYDRINQLMSLGSGAWYRRWALRRSGLISGMRVLDVAVGTGTLARAVLRTVGPSGAVIGLDPSIGMLDRARRLRIPLIQGVAERLPVRDAVFDGLTMGFALRHVADLKGTFAEYVRVLKPGGTVVILDFARPRSRIGLRLARIYFGAVVPWMSAHLAGSSDARQLVQYCWDTVELAAPSEMIMDAMTDVGFAVIRSVTWLGVFTEYVGRKPAARAD